MADSGIRHVVSSVPVPRTEFEDEEFHALMHGNAFPAAPVERQLFYRDDTHKWSIYNGTDWVELTVATVATHHATHENGGADEISVAGLSGELADDQPAKAHDLGGTKHNADTLANLNAKVNDATLDDRGDPRDPNAHKASHEDTGADEISIAGLLGEPAELTTHKGLNSIHHSNVADLTFIIDGGGSAITTGEKGHLEIPFACTITQVTALADQSGSIVVDIWKDTYANFPPTNADSITAAAPPTITTAQKSQDSTLTGWTTAIAAGDILAFNVDSITTITRVTISLKVEKS